MVGLGYRDYCRRFFPELRIFTLPRVYILQCLTYMKQNIQLFYTHQNDHEYETREAHHFVPSFHRLGRAIAGVLIIIV